MYSVAVGAVQETVAPTNNPFCRIDPLKRALHRLRTQRIHIMAQCRYVVCLYLLLCWLDFASGVVSSICPNGCSSHGVCADSAMGGCECFPSFTGTDCSQRVCPSSRAWVDMPSDSLTAHAEFAECSNMVCESIRPYRNPTQSLLFSIHGFRGNVIDQPVYVNAVVDSKGLLVISVSIYPLP